MIEIDGKKAYTNRMSKSKKSLSETSNIGDKRLDKRLEKICESFSKHLEASIPQSHADISQMKAGYNFFKHKKVNAEKIINAHLEHHQQKRHKIVKQTLLCPQDKTEVDFTGNKSAKQFGPLNHLNQRGFLLQSTLITSEKGVPIGLFKQSSIIRKEETFSKRTQHKSFPRQPIENKETNHWLQHFEELQDYFRDCPAIEVFCTNDREGDLYELFAKQSSDNVHLIVRSQHNRLLEDENQRLHDKVKSSPIQTRQTIKVTDRRTSKQRKAKVQIRYTSATIKLGAPTKWQKKLKPIKLWAMQVEEINPPKGYKAVQWILLTTYPINTLEDALRINRYYVLRWIIERFHYTLKSGAKIKDLQLTTPKRVLNAVACYSISAVNIMRMNYLARACPEMTALDAGFEIKQLKILFAYVKKHISKNITFDKDHPPTIRQVIIFIARIGGFTNFSNQPFPGLKTFWRGWNIFNFILTAYAINVNEL